LQLILIVVIFHSKGKKTLKTKSKSNKSSAKDEDYGMMVGLPSIPSSRRRSNSKSSRGSRVKFFPDEPSFAEKLMIKGKEAALVAAKLASVASREASKKGVLVAAAAARVAKSKTSSPLERLLLQATVPTDTPVLSSDMSMIFSEIRSYGRGRQPGYNPYEKTLHKLWTKVILPFFSNIQATFSTSFETCSSNAILTPIPFPLHTIPLSITLFS
jgi:hypothetical protein